MSGRPPLPVHLRDATDADAEGLNAIYNHYVLHSTCTYQTVPETDVGRAAWLAEHGGRYPVIVAVSDDEMLGWASLSPHRPREAYRHTVEDSVYVRHDRHGRGVGGALLAELIRRGTAVGFHTILAGVSADQPPSLALHEKFGFRQVARFREVGHKFGRWLDVVYLQRML